MLEIDESQRTKLLAVGVIGIIAILGCWFFFFRSSEAHVSGLVTLDQTPLQAAQLVFLAEGSELTSPVLAVTNSEGRYKLAGSAGAGVPPGKYRVVVTKIGKLDGTALSGEDLESARETGQLKNLVPASYENFETTPLRAEFQSGNNTVHLELRNQP
jgi:hypothetical protein